jgi:hypothetical protein
MNDELQKLIHFRLKLILCHEKNLDKKINVDFTLQDNIIKKKVKDKFFFFAANFCLRKGSRFLLSKRRFGFFCCADFFAVFFFAKIFCMFFFKNLRFLFFKRCFGFFLKRLFFFCKIPFAWVFKNLHFCFQSDALDFFKGI